MISRERNLVCILLSSLFLSLLSPEAFALYTNIQKSSFRGKPISGECHIKNQGSRSYGSTSLVMRKQKASDRRTRRLQREGRNDDPSFVSVTSRESSTLSQKSVIGSPMGTAVWDHKTVGSSINNSRRPTGGRGRSRKRSNMYDSLSSYHAEFLNLLTLEYQAEVSIPLYHAN